MAIDRAKALEVCGGDEDLLREVTVEFLKSLPADRVALGSAVGANDFPAAGRAAHKLKSSLGAVGAIAAAAAAARLEGAARASEPSLRKLHEVLEAELDRAAAELSASIAGSPRS